jgi:hypothetical protein
MNPTVDVAEEVHRLVRRIIDGEFEHASRLTVVSNSRDGKPAVSLHFAEVLGRRDGRDVVLGGPERGL